MILGVALALGTSTSAEAAARRIVLLHPDADLTRSVDLALYPWDIAVVPVDEAPPDATTPDAGDRARALAKRHDADALAWIARSGDTATLWFFDAASDSLHSRPLPSAASDDPAELAAVALTLKTFVRATLWEARIPTVVRDSNVPGWESALELDVLARSPLGGASGEPRVGLWASEWYGTRSWMWGAAVGASAGVGMTLDDGTTRGALQDVDLRADLRGRARFARRFTLEPRIGVSAHVERADVTTASPAVSEAFTRIDPSVDVGLFVGWEVTRTFTIALGAEALAFVRYQRWLVGQAETSGQIEQTAVFSPSPIWLQGGASVAWSFR